MWEKFWNYVTWLTSVNHKTEKNTDGIAEIREELRDFDRNDKTANQKIDSMTQTLQKLVFEHLRDRENAETEREMQRLQLENILLRADQRLLPGVSPLDSEKEALREALETLKRENQELRKRLENPEEK